MKAKVKTFDCVEMKRRAAERIHALLANMTSAEKLEYWRKRSEAFRREQEALKARKP